jgi:hypothetical protein
VAPFPMRVRIKAACNKLPAFLAKQPDVQPG